MRRRLALLTLLLAAATLTSTGQAASPIGWRTDGSGRYPGANPPLNWSAERSVAWKVPLAGASNATPVVLDEAGLVIVLDEPDGVVAIRTAGGEVAWRDSLTDIDDRRVGSHKANGLSTPTPVSDGTTIYASFGDGVVSAHALDGTRRWARVVQRPNRGWGHSTSPVLAGGTLVVHYVDLIGLDPATGEERWRQPSDARWGSLLATRIGDTDVVITASGDVVQAASGEVVTQGIGSLKFASPVLDDGVVYFIEKKATAVRLPRSLDGAFETIWQSRLQGSRHYASPVVHEGLIYALSREETFAILDAATGEVVVEQSLKLGSGTNSAYPSLVLAGDRLLVSVEDGVTAVLEPGRTYKELGRNRVEGFRSSPVAVGDRLYLRAFDHLYCFRDAG